MRKIFFLLLISARFAAFAQPGGSVTGAGVPQVSYATLPGSGYTFQQVSAGGNLPFTESGLLQPSADFVYWLKITISNPGRLSGQYNIFVEPSVFNTVYYFDANAQKWVIDSAGVTITPRSPRQQSGALPFILSQQPVNVIYVKMNLARLGRSNYPVKPIIQFEEGAVTDKQQDILIYGWVAALSVLFFFFLYNLYQYSSFRDVSVLFYLIAQAGAMVYITAYRGVFKYIIPNKIFSLALWRGNWVNYYDIDNMLQHAGIMLIIFGFIQLTRSYLNTKIFLPRTDWLLKYGLYIYLCASVILIGINTLFFYVEYYTLVYDNIFLLLLFSLIIYTCILGYRRRLRASGPFLLANALPLVLIVCITLFHIVISVETINNLWLPSLAIVSQAFCFSVALVARTKLIQAELNAKEMEAQQLSFEVQKISISMQVEKARSELLQERLEANQRELASTTLYMLQKNELLATLRSQVEEINRLYPKLPHGKLSGMESILKSSLHLDDDWKKFKLHFEQLHPHFFEDLEAKHPSLTKNEVRLYAYFHINLSPKEIASLLNIEPDSVRRAKSRLLKKMGLADTESAAGGPGEE